MTRAEKVSLASLAVTILVMNVFVVTFLTPYA